jgi:hypothetical protein
MTETNVMIVFRKRYGKRLWYCKSENGVSWSKHGLLSQIKEVVAESKECCPHARYKKGEA